MSIILPFNWSSFLPFKPSKTCQKLSGPSTSGLGLVGTRIATTLLPLAYIEDLRLHLPQGIRDTGLGHKFVRIILSMSIHIFPDSSYRAPRFHPICNDLGIVSIKFCCHLTISSSAVNTTGMKLFSHLEAIKNPFKDMQHLFFDTIRLWKMKVLFYFRGNPSSTTLVLV